MSVQNLYLPFLQWSAVRCVFVIAAISSMGAISVPVLYGGYENDNDLNNMDLLCIPSQLSHYPDI